MSNRFLRTIVYAVLTVLVGTAYMHIGDVDAFALETDGASPSDGEILVVFEEGTDVGDPEEAVAEVLQG